MPALTAQPTVYARHQPEETILYRVFQEHYKTFIQSAQTDSIGSGFPSHVNKEVEAYFGCGILANGFIRLQCGTCKREKWVAFSCKKRGFCPSCGGRRMNEVATNLVEKVLPKTPVRQWVISFPYSVRYALAYNPMLVTKALSIYIRIISNWYEKTARKRGISGKTGAVTFVQRFGGAINLNVHFHSLFIDGVFTQKKRGGFRFAPIPAPSDDEIVSLATRIKKRITRFLGKKGCELNDFSEDPFAHEQPVLSHLSTASIQSRIGLGERAGQRVRRLGNEMSQGYGYTVAKRCALSDGFSLHANVQIKGKDRKRLEKLCRYTARPPIALERLSETSGGKILYQLKTAYSDGTTHILFDPLELVEKIITLIPPPRANLLRYHGILAPNSEWRTRIVPKRKEALEEPRHSSKTKWADLLKRSFAIDVLHCDRCGGQIFVVATIQDPRIVKKLLERTGLPSEIPKRSPPRAPPEQEFPAASSENFSQIGFQSDSFE